jgi:hypothetical protein
VSDDDLSEVIHIAGPTIAANAIRRQRCMWCGALISEDDLANIARPLEPGEDPDNPEPWEPAAWGVNELVAVAGTNPRAKWLVEPVVEDGHTKIPERSCMNLDNAVTS